jgi:cysteine desulfurase / selenocysteine lyase
MTTLTNTRPVAGLDVPRLREDFPVLRQRVHGKPLVYLDNAATAQKPRAVLDAVRRYYTEDNANIHRAVHDLGQRATRDYEDARVTVQRFLRASSPKEIVFTRGATEAINLVAHTWGRKNLRPGDEVIVSHMEHHSNIVPWQLVCEATGAILKVVPINDAGEFLLDEFEKLLGPRTRFVSVVHLSNSLGTVNPVREIIARAHAHGVPVLVDAAQSIAHLPLDVADLDCDFLAFSGHKIYGPTGIGVLYGKLDQLAAMPPYQGGGDMIASVSFAGTTYAEPPARFEAGTPNIAGAVGLAAALDYVQRIGLERINAHELKLLQRTLERLREISGVRIIGNARHHDAAVSFVVEDPPLSALDVGTALDVEGIAVRTGHHCCQPVMDWFGIPATVRVSFALYNTLAEIDHFAEVLEAIVKRSRRHPSAPVSAPVGKLVFPEASAPTPQEAAEEVVDLFGFLDDWSDRYGHLLELGQKLPHMPDELKTDANRVRGCQSTVYLWARQKPGADDVVEFLADSDADLVRGLIGLLQQVYSGQRAADILAFNVEEFFARLGLDHHLTLGRRNGLASMVQRIRAFAESLPH